MVVKSEISYMHFIKKTDEGYYWCDWYRDHNENFYTFERGLKVCFIKEKNKVKTIRPLHSVNIDPDECNWEKASGTIKLDGFSEQGYGIFKCITNINECINEMLGEKNANK